MHSLVGLISEKKHNTFRSIFTHHCKLPLPIEHHQKFDNQDKRNISVSLS